MKLLQFFSFAKSGGIMKQVELKRALLVLCVCCMFLFFYLYWQQSSENAQTKSGSIYTSYRQNFATHKKRNAQPHQWTWQCVNQRCEKRLIKPKTAIPIVSRTTCNMLCGSTQLWPQPTGPVTLGSKPVAFNHHTLQLSTPNLKGQPTEPLLRQAFVIFTENVVRLVQDPYYIEQTFEISQVQIEVNVRNANTVRLHLHTSEAYNLTMHPVRDVVLVKISAENYFGARHGLETLSQLIWWDEYTGALKILKSASVHDSPAFNYRGLMVDTARNFMSIDALQRVIIGMAASKLNVLHWHVSDSQSFPLEIAGVPQLTQYGAYASDQIYSQDDVKELVEFALVRGIRILIEIDAPAHAGNGWNFGPAVGLGELAVCVNERPWSLYCGEPPCGQLNPTNPHVYEVLETIYKEVLRLTGNYGDMFHLGGDEVNLECWAQHLQNTLGNFTDLHNLWGEFTQRALRRLRKANRNTPMQHVIIWSSKLTERPYLGKFVDRKQVVVQVWGGSTWPDTAELLSEGYKIIVSHVDAWYLDCGFGRWTGSGDAACGPYHTWQTVYNHRPWQQLHWNRTQRQILGGEVCLWSELVDEGSLDSRLWPRAAAVAERLWSDPPIQYNGGNGIQEDVFTRINTHRDRLISRGIAAEAIWPLWCVHNPGMCL